MEHNFSHISCSESQGSLKSTQGHKTQITIVFTGTRKVSFGKVTVFVKDSINISFSLLHSFDTSQALSGEVCALAHTRAKAFRGVVNYTCKLLTTRFVHNCLCLIKICAYFHVTIKRTAAIDY